MIIGRRAGRKDSEHKNWIGILRRTQHLLSMYSICIQALLQHVFSIYSVFIRRFIQLSLRTVSGIPQKLLNVCSLFTQDLLMTYSSYLLSVYSVFIHFYVWLLALKA